MWLPRVREKHYFKFGCLKPMISGPKHFAWNSKLKNNWALSTWMLILGMSYVLTSVVTKARYQRQIELVKTNKMAVEWWSLKEY